MLLVAFAFPPPATPTYVAADLREQVCRYTSTAPICPVADWMHLLASLNPVLNWKPTDQCLALAENGWEQLLQFSGTYLRPVPAASATTSERTRGW